jgi:hypothetical protein
MQPMDAPIRRGVCRASAAIVLASACCLGCGRGREAGGRSEVEARLEQAKEASTSYRGRIKASDGRLGIPCTVSLAMGLKEGEWLPLGDQQATTGGGFDGSIAAVTAAPVEMPYRLSVDCRGYAPLKREVKWNISPTQTQVFDLGELIVTVPTKS